jgi:hypothetical protein
MRICVVAVSSVCAGCAAVNDKQQHGKAFGRKHCTHARAETPALHADVHEAKLLNCSKPNRNPLLGPYSMGSFPNWKSVTKYYKPQTAAAAAAACAAAAEMKSSVCMNIRIT